MDKPIDNDEFNALCQQYLILEDARATIVAEQKGIREKLDTILASKDSHASKHFKAELTRSTTMKWDQEKLEAILRSTGSPHIKLTYSVPKADYDALGIADRKTLNPALTVSKGRLNLKIEKTS